VSRKVSALLLLLGICGSCVLTIAVAGAAPKTSSLSYGKAQAEAQKTTSADCTEDTECLYWAASCGRISPASFDCIDSTWGPSIVPGTFIRCDSEMIVKATRYEVSTKPVLGSVQCYTTRE
jgi:hypothetical protein